MFLVLHELQYLIAYGEWILTDAGLKLIRNVIFLYHLHYYNEMLGL